MNGVVNFSVLDGWWLEGYREGAGWALTEKRTYQNQEYQDQLDAATIYSILEQEILPLYYARNKKGYSEGWIRTIKNSIAQIAPHYTMKRQLDDYYSKFYTKEAKTLQGIGCQQLCQSQGTRSMEGRSCGQVGQHRSRILRKDRRTGERLSRKR